MNNQLRIENEMTDRAVVEHTNNGDHWRFCLRCGHELINEKCKLRCPVCHYFMSCSDFDHLQT